MVDLNKIKYEYEKIKSRDKDIRLLSLDKIIKLEEAKSFLIDKYLSKIKKIDNNFNIISSAGIDIDDIIKFSYEFFGTLNYKDFRSENNELVIVLAFSFSLITITCNNENIKYSINLYWDY